MKNNLLRLAGIFALLFFACEKWDYDTREFPEVLTISVDAGSFNRTVAYGRLVGLERGTLEQIGHCWSKQNTTLTLAQAHTSLSGGAVAPDGSFESVLQGLSPDTVYFLRAYAIYTFGSRRDTVFESGYKNFTPASLNVVSTSIRLEDMNVRVTSAITGLAQNTATAFGHCWSNQTEVPSIDDGISHRSDFGALNQDSIFQDFLSGLDLAARYYVRAYAIIAGKVSYGNTLQIFMGDIWVQRTGYPGPTTVTGFSLDEKIYLGLGIVDIDMYDRRFWQYDPVTKNWTQVADFPGTLQRDAVSFVAAGKAYVGLGWILHLQPFAYIYLNEIYAYDAVNNQWIEKAPFPGDKRSTNLTFSIGGKGYICCGADIQFDTTSTYFKETWSYDPFDSSIGTDVNGEPLGRWVKKADFPGITRGGAFAFSIGDRGFLGSGVDVATGNILNDFWEYDPNSLENGTDDTGQPKGAWTQKAGVSPSYRLRPVTFSVGEFGYMGLGRSSEQDVYYSDFWRYDPKTDEWRTISSIPGITTTYGVGLGNSSTGFIYFSQLNSFWEYIPPQ